MGKIEKTTDAIMDDNLKFWNEAKTPPKDALKKITGGRLKGMTDINPTWRIQKMTEYFGPCGIGWYWKPIRQWTEKGSNDQVAVFVNVELKIFNKETNAWSEPIFGTGGSKLIVKESSGLYTDDEAYKKATTDALSTAMKMLGVAADIYMGNDDGSKYQAHKRPTKSYMTKQQSSRFIKFCTDENLNPTEIAREYGITKKITTDKFENYFNTIKNHVETGEIGYRFAVPDSDESDDQQDS